MTYGDIFIQALIETVPEKKVELLKRFEFVKAVPAVAARLNREVPDEQAEMLIKRLRQDKAGIIKWLLEGDKSRLPFDA